jgi:hypothetical protein
LHACRKKSGLCTFTHLYVHAIASCNVATKILCMHMHRTKLLACTLVRMHARQLKLQVQTLRCMDACTRAF